MGRHPKEKSFETYKTVVEGRGTSGIEVENNDKRTTETV